LNDTVSWGRKACAKKTPKEYSLYFSGDTNGRIFWGGEIGEENVFKELPAVSEQIRPRRKCIGNIRGEEGMRGETSAANQALFMEKLDPVLF